MVEPAYTAQAKRERGGLALDAEHHSGARRSRFWLKPGRLGLQRTPKRRQKFRFPLSARALQANWLSARNRQKRLPVLEKI